MTVVRWPSLLLNVDFVGQCFGTCGGCLLTPEERQAAEPSLDESTLFKRIKELRQQLPVNQLDYAALAFGRGNTLGLSDTHWKTIENASNHFQSLFQPTAFTLECSTGLVGKIDNLISSAQRRISQLGPSLRFVVVANSDLYSTAYWRNVDTFFEGMMAYRGGKIIDGSGDVLVLNLVADRLPNVSELLSRIADYPFPVNVAWLPSSSSDIDVFRSIRPWMKLFLETMKRRSFDSNLVRFSHALRESAPSLPEALHASYENSERFWWLSRNGLTPGLFSPLGDVDFDRLSIKSGMVAPPIGPIALHKRLRKRLACRTCTFQNHCLSSGVAGLAAMSSDTSVCPLGLRD